MSDLNSWNITGRLTKDAEFKTLPSGKHVTEMSCAVNTGFGQYKKTTYVKVSVWGDSLQKLVPYLKKGSLIATSGELTTNEWTSKQDGMLHTDLCISARDVQLLQSKAEQSGSNEEESEPAPDPVF